MDLRELERKLYSAARVKPPTGEMPFAFEKRIMARLASGRTLNLEELWARALWRSAAICVAIVLVVGATSRFALNTSKSSTDLSKDFERTMLAAVDQEPDSAW